MFTLRWGVLATGGIAKTFVEDVILDPATRGVQDVSHKVIAVGASSSIDKAKAFVLDTIGSNSTTRAYGTYAEVVNDSEVDIVYVASPASHHYKHVLLALGAGKHVCCEKPFTINAAQTEHLIATAWSKNLFLMEAVWTRFFPSIKPLLTIFHSSAPEERIIGKPLRLFADFSLQVDPRKSDPPQGRWDHRLYDPNLGGGALLDLGIYCLTWASMVLWKDPRNEKAMPKVVASVVKTKFDGSEDKDGWKGEVDESTTITLEFEKLGATAILTTSLAVRSPGDGVVIQGEKGDISIPHVPCRPETFKVHLHGEDPTLHEYRIPKGHGLHYEADACARAIRDGKLETSECSLEDSLVVMKLMDGIRVQGQFRYPELLEALQEGL